MIAKPGAGIKIMCRVIICLTMIFLACKPRNNSGLKASSDVFDELDISKIPYDSLKEFICSQKIAYVFIGNAESLGYIDQNPAINRFSAAQLAAHERSERARSAWYHKKIQDTMRRLEQKLAQENPACRALAPELSASGESGSVTFVALVDGPNLNDSRDSLLRSSVYGFRKEGDQVSWQMLTEQAWDLVNGEVRKTTQSHFEALMPRDINHVFAWVPTLAKDPIFGADQRPFTFLVPDFKGHGAQWHTLNADPSFSDLMDERVFEEKNGMYVKRSTLGAFMLDAYSEKGRLSPEESDFYIRLYKAQTICDEIFGAGHPDALDCQIKLEASVSEVTDFDADNDCSATSVDDFLQGTRKQGNPEKQGIKKQGNPEKQGLKKQGNPEKQGSRKQGETGKQGFNGLFGGSLAITLGEGFWANKAQGGKGLVFEQRTHPFPQASSTKAVPDGRRILGKGLTVVRSDDESAKNLLSIPATASDMMMIADSCYVDLGRLVNPEFFKTDRSSPERIRLSTLSTAIPLAADAIEYDAIDGFQWYYLHRIFMDGLRFTPDPITWNRRRQPRRGYDSWMEEKSQRVVNILARYKTSTDPSCKVYTNTYDCEQRDGDVSCERQEPQYYEQQEMKIIDVANEFKQALVLFRERLPRVNEAYATYLAKKQALFVNLLPYGADKVRSVVLVGFFIPKSEKSLPAYTRYLESKEKFLSDFLTYRQTNWWEPSLPSRVFTPAFVRMTRYWAAFYLSKGNTEVIGNYIAYSEGILGGKGEEEPESKHLTDVKALYQGGDLGEETRARITEILLRD